LEEGIRGDVLALWLVFRTVQELRVPFGVQDLPGNFNNFCSDNVLAFTVQDCSGLARALWCAGPS
jgi:hypothetical protein